jgi:hypothetical protein
MQRNAFKFNKETELVPIISTAVKGVCPLHVVHPAARNYCVYYIAVKNGCMCFIYFCELLCILMLPHVPCLTHQVPSIRYVALNRFDVTCVAR